MTAEAAVGVFVAVSVYVAVAVDVEESCDIDIMNLHALQAFYKFRVFSVILSVVWPHSPQPSALSPQPSATEAGSNTLNGT